MLRDIINDQWLWLGAAGLFLLLLGLILVVYRVRRSGHEFEEGETQHEGWRPTGRIDFVELGDKNGHFLLQAEEARIFSSLGGVEHHEIRWRRATLKEAKKVVKTYHAQLDLETTASQTPMVIPWTRGTESQNGSRDLSTTGPEHSGDKLEDFSDKIEELNHPQ